MSNAIFPTVPGMTCEITKTPTWSTAIQTSVSGKEIRMANRARAIWNFEVAFEFLRADARFNEYQQLVAFYNARQGSFDSFLLLDPNDNTATAQSIGTGDGVTTAFQLQHQLGSWGEPIGYAPAPTLYINGIQTTAFTCPDGLNVTFNSAPAKSAAITWSGQFYYRARFAQDTMQFKQFMQNLWQLDSCQMVGVI